VYNITDNFEDNAVSKHLVKRAGFWRFVRRVPKEFRAFDKRGIVQHSTKIRIADDPRSIRAGEVAERMNGALESYWRDLIESDQAQAVADYEAAMNAARRIGVSAPIDDASKRTIAELLDRIEKLENKLGGVNTLADDRSAVLAVYDAAPKPAMTFKQCAERYIEAIGPGWSNPKHAGQWRATLATYAYPVIGSMPVNKIGSNGGTDMIMQVLQPIWYIKTETANRVRGRIEAVIDWAKANGYRDGENPARWRGDLDKLLPARGKVAPVKHRRALPFAEMPDFIAKLRAVPGTAARALEFTILTAGRTSEILGAKRSEFDLAARMWTVPANRMKARRPHRVALSDAAIALINAMPADSAYLFPGAKEGRPLSDMALTMTLRRMGLADIAVTHGFRSTFNDWAHEKTDYPNEAIEMAIAHVVSNKVEAAYRRGDLLQKRHALMADWCSYCNGGA
jgi:integrase